MSRIVRGMRYGLLALLFALAAPWARAEEEKPDPARELFEKAVEKQRKKRWRSARGLFRKILEDHPDSPLAEMAEARGGDNAYLGTTPIWTGGPFERRIDVAVMGDGFTLDVSDQRMEERWAEYCIDVLWNEKAFEEYRNYFNIWFVRLASFEEGVDPNLSPEELKKAQERNRRRRRDINYKIDFNTALNCKAAGPQGQVMADRSLVYKWLGIANEDVPGCGDDGFVIAFARFGKLGMGGGGVANVGKPDKSVTVHEFGHAFSRLLDEYAVNPMAPQGMYGRTIKAANAYASPTEPKPEEVPWAHMLERRARVKGVGIYEGGATFKKGVWRPARTCAMNIGGNQFCPVCREQTILVIYEYVSPIDVAEPDPAREVEVVAGDRDAMLSVTPMEPARHRLEVDWYVAPLKVTTPNAMPAAPEEEPAAGDDAYDDTIFEAEPRGGPGRRGMMRTSPFRGPRSLADRSHFDEPPEGEKSRLGKSKLGRRRKPRYHVFPVGKLPAGRYLITAEVRDETRWVVKDEKHLLEERVSWRVAVSAPAGK